MRQSSRVPTGLACCHEADGAGVLYWPAGAIEQQDRPRRARLSRRPSPSCGGFHLGFGIRQATRLRWADFERDAGLHKAGKERRVFSCTQTSNAGGLQVSDHLTDVFRAQQFATVGTPGGRVAIMRKAAENSEVRLRSHR